MFRSKFFQHKVYSCLTYESHSPPPSEIFVPDLDDIDQPAERAAKRRRIEDQGTRYLKGHSLYIASASLKGPFDGQWRNPWKKRRQHIGTQAQERGDLVWQDTVNKDATAIEKQHERPGREERRRLKKQRAERAANLQKDGLGRSPAKPVDLTSEGGHDGAVAQPKFLSGRTEDWLRRQQLSRSTPEPPTDDFADAHGHGTRAGELTPSKPPRPLGLGAQGNYGNNTTRNVFQRHTVEPEPSPFRMRSLSPQTKSSPVPRLGARHATEAQTLRPSVHASSYHGRAKARSCASLWKDHNDKVHEENPHRRNETTELIQENLEGLDAEIPHPGTSTSLTHGYDVSGNVADREIGEAPIVHVSKETMEGAQSNDIRHSGDSLTVTSSALVSTSLQVNISGDSPVRYVEDSTQDDPQQHIPSFVTLTHQDQPASEVSRLPRLACEEKAGANVIEGEVVTFDQQPLPTQATPSPQMHPSGFTPVNSHFNSPETARAANSSLNGVPGQVSGPSLDGTRKDSLADFNRAQDSISHFGGLRNAKLLSQRAIEQALTPSQSATAAVLHADSAEDILSFEEGRMRTIQGYRAQAEPDRVSFRRTMQQSAERCAQANGNIGGKKSTKRRRSPTTGEDGGLAAVRSTRTAPSDVGVAFLDARHPLNASPIPNSSTGFVYRRGKHAADHSESANEIRPVTGNAIPQKKKPRLMSFASPLTTVKPSANGGEPESNGPLQPSLDQEPPASARSSQDDWRLVEQHANRIIPSHPEGDNGKGSINARLRKALRKSGASFEADRQVNGDVQHDSDKSNLGEQQSSSAGATAQPPSGPHPSMSGGAIPDHQDSAAYPTSNGDLSTQAAISMARIAFQHELISPLKEVVVAEPNGFPTPVPPAQAVALTAITPFRDFDSPVRAAHETPTEDMAISTQALFDAAAGLAFSTVKKSKGKKRASFAPSPIRERYDVNTNTSPGILPVDTEASFETAIGSANGGTAKPAAHNASDAGSQPRPQNTSPENSTKGYANPTPVSSGLAFSISSQGPIKAVSYQEGQRSLNDGFDLEAVIDDAGSFLQSWSLDYDPDKSPFKGKSAYSSAQSRKPLSYRSS